jgi:hypothetical protein
MHNLHWSPNNYHYMPNVSIQKQAATSRPEPGPSLRSCMLFWLIFDIEDNGDVFK